MCVQFKVIVVQKNEDITNRKAMFFEQRITKKCTTDTSFAGVSFRQPEKYIVKQKKPLGKQAERKELWKIEFIYYWNCLKNLLCKRRKDEAVLLVHLLSTRNIKSKCTSGVSRLEDFSPRYAAYCFV